jgi:hypothetical protein
MTVDGVMVVLSEDGVGMLGELRILLEHKLN